MRWYNLTQIVLLAICSVGSTLAQNHDHNSPPKGPGMPGSSDWSKRTLSVGFIVFPGFQPLDVFGPIDIMYLLSSAYKMSLSIISHKQGPISARSPPHMHMPGMPKIDSSHILAPQIIATHSFDNAPAVDVLFISGGTGLMALDQSNDTAVEDFIARRYPQLEYLISICTGSAALAKAGVLEGKRATTNKASWSWVTSVKGAEKVKWVPNARWVVDGNVWSSSGVSAGLDATYALLKHIYGTQHLNRIMNVIEYAPHEDPDWDPFAVVHNVPGANKTRSLQDCVSPVTAAR